MFSFRKKRVYDRKVFNITEGINGPLPSRTPSDYQKKQISRKYGMFIHFGINTFHDKEWTDGSLPAESYNPECIDAAQWVATAKAAGMKYIILITKHHDGFCLWDSPLTDYSVAHSPVKTDVIDAVAQECRIQGIELGLYYSLWDRHCNDKVRRRKDDNDYNRYMLAQLEELMTSYGEICELWLDGGWVKQNDRWPTMEIYELVKKHQKGCQIGINWTIGHEKNDDRHMILPDKLNENDPIRYFPSDFRLGDPYLPVENDPKIYCFKDKHYYMPWESTLCLNDMWFNNTKDKGLKSVEELVEIYKRATNNDNILIINCPPGKDGKMREADAKRLVELKTYLRKNHLLE